ncbi:MAG: class I SAM-dependent methyltransferase [Rubrobacteraceae bacterium]
MWPSAIALARHISGMTFSGKRTIEIGCGVGLPSVVALERGAESVATDHYPGALDFASYNAEANAGKSLKTALLDWRNPEFDGLGKFDFILAADVLYERVNARYLANLIPELLAPEGEILLADPRRPGAELFTEEMEGRGFRASKTSVMVEQSGREVVVNIHGFRGV